MKGKDNSLIRNDELNIIMVVKGQKMTWKILKLSTEASQHIIKYAPGRTVILMTET